MPPSGPEPTLPVTEFSPTSGGFRQPRKYSSSVDDPATKIVGVDGDEMGASPHNLLADTLGDELRLATQGNSRVFGVALKDRAAILPTGFSANGAYWIDHASGAWVTSTYYVTEAPRWLTTFNSQKHAQKYLNLDWKDADGQVLGSTAPRDGADGKPIDYYELVGRTPYANDYQIEFARELIQQEKLGQGTVTDLLVLSLSANDLAGHAYGPDSPQIHAMALALDRQISEFAHVPPAAVRKPILDCADRRPWHSAHQRHQPEVAYPSRRDYEQRPEDRIEQGLGARTAQARRLRALRFVPDRVRQQRGVWRKDRPRPMPKVTSPKPCARWVS